MAKEKRDPHTFIDLFAGCGGISLGFVQANWQGVFAVEKSGDGFATFRQNFLSGPPKYRFAWPQWLEERPHSIDDLLAEHMLHLRGLRESVDLVAGGPPCQGFSWAGRRIKSDPRNRLFKKYVEFVDNVKPRAIVLENVPGMQVAHFTKKRGNRSVSGPVPKSFYEKLVDALDEIGYIAEGRVLDASRFGVPQRRPRLIVVGLQKVIAKKIQDGVPAIFDYIERSRTEQLITLGLPEEVSSRDALSDLTVSGKPLMDCDDPVSQKGFFTIVYEGPITKYQKLMNAGMVNGVMDSMRLARHRKPTLKRFNIILRECRKGVNLGKADRERLGLLKHRTVPMDPKRPAPTITTLPDDLLHYSEPRILTVRESARLQSFPDWFKFCGNYTTGGNRRKTECPRYTQVGNAVPPLLARAIGNAVARALIEVNQQANQLGRSHQIRVGNNATEILA